MYDIPLLIDLFISLQKNIHEIHKIKEHTSLNLLTNLLRRGVVIIANAQFHSIKPELRFWAG